MHRRQFLAQSSLAAGTLLTSDVKSLLPQDRKLGIALVGLGNYATNQLAPALQQTELCQLTGIVTGTPQKAAEWSSKYQIPHKNIYNYETFDQIKDNPDIDIVYVVLPNSMHAEYTIRAAKAGKHVICEKPMGLNVKECEQMIKACKEAKVKLSVGYRLYFEPHHLEVRRLGTEKALGAVKMIESSLGFSMADPKVLAQGFVTDKNVFKGIYEMMMFQMEFPSGAVSNSTTTYSSYIDRLYATTGYPVVWVRAFLQRHRCKRRILGRKNIFQNTCFSTD